MKPGRSRDMRRLPIDANRPLAGIAVLDFGQVYQGPYASLLMAEAGATRSRSSHRRASRCAGGRRRARADLSDRDAELQQARDHIELEWWRLLALSDQTRPKQAG